MLLLWDEAGEAEPSKSGDRAGDLFFSGDSPSMGAATYIVAPITALLGNDHERVEIDALELTVKSAEEPKTARLERVWLDDPRPRAGRTVPLKVLLRTYRGEDVLRGGAGMVTQLIPHRPADPIRPPSIKP
mgnify:CR=1 FL=1